MGAVDVARDSGRCPLLPTLNRSLDLHPVWLCFNSSLNALNDLVLLKATLFCVLRAA